MDMYFLDGVYTGSTMDSVFLTEFLNNEPIQFQPQDQQGTVTVHQGLGNAELPVWIFGTINGKTCAHYTDGPDVPVEDPNHSPEDPPDVGTPLDEDEQDGRDCTPYYPPFDDIDNTQSVICEDYDKLEIDKGHLDEEDYPPMGGYDQNEQGEL